MHGATVRFLVPEWLNGKVLGRERLQSSEDTIIMKDITKI